MPSARVLGTVCLFVLIYGSNFQIMASAVRLELPMLLSNNVKTSCIILINYFFAKYAKFHAPYIHKVVVVVVVIVVIVETIRESWTAL